MYAKRSDQALQAAPPDQREHERCEAMLGAKLFVPAESLTLECAVVDLSVGGARIRGDELPPLSTFVVLYIEGFGRFEAVTLRCEGDTLALRFVCKDAKRLRLVEQLKAYLAQGLLGVTKLRQHQRNPSQTAGYFSRADGEYIACEILDISLQGVSLHTKARPPVGELVNLGLTRGRVIRHHDLGIAIQFLMRADMGMVQRHGE